MALNQQTGIVFSTFRILAKKIVPVLLAAWAAIAVFSTGWANPAGAAERYASIVIDNHTGRVLYSRQADALRYPASLTKIMTLYMVFEALKAGDITLQTRLKVTARAAAQPPSKLGLKNGQTIRVSDAIRALVTKSANDVASVVAENSAGTEAKFAEAMTRKAHQLGMTKTVFKNASGLPNKHQKTTARDMATLSRRIMEDFPEYYSYFSLKQFKYKGRSYRNHNGLLYSYKGTDGIKTGYTRASGFNLAASVRREDKHLVAVVMGGKSSKSRNLHMQTLLNRALPKAVARSKVPQKIASMPLPLRNPLDRGPVTVASAAVNNQAGNAVLTAAAAVSLGSGVDLKDLDPQLALQADQQQKVSDRSRLRSGFHVQVGAYTSQSEAVARLTAVQSKAQTVLAGHDPITLPLPKPKRYLFRARFAGFTQDTAQRTCSQLKRKSINCIVMRAE